MEYNVFCIKHFLAKRHKYSIILDDSSYWLTIYV